MLYSFATVAALLGLATAAPVAGASSSIWVTVVPNYVRPYAIPHMLAGGCVVGTQIYRFPVTGSSSGSAFSLIQTNAPGSSALGVLPHLHEAHYENFFNFRGRFQLWTDKNDEENSRMMLPGDFGAVPHNTTHTFQILDPDTEMVGVIQPGGFEKLFYALASSNYTSSTLSPYDPSANDSTTTTGPDAGFITTLEGFDVYAQLQYSPTGVGGNLTNGAFPTGSAWHSGSNALATDSSSPFFVAKDYGPKYLNSATVYQVIQPFITATQSASNFTLSTITTDRTSFNITVPTHKFAGHAAFEVMEGSLTVKMLGETLSLAQGDVVFIPGNTSYTYWSEVAYTKFLHIGQGGEGLDSALIKAGKSWDSPVWPTS